MNNIIKETNLWDKNGVLWPCIEKDIPEPFIFITPSVNTCTIAHMTHVHRRMNETMEHKLHRIRHVRTVKLFKLFLNF